MASRKLKHYFQEHPITLVSSAPLADIIQNREATGRIAKWAIELGAYHIKYEPHTAIKSQVLADFINDWTAQTSRSLSTGRCTLMGVGSCKDQELVWFLPLPHEKFFAMFCSYNSSAPTMHRNMKAYSMGCG